jgi:hypothetical protein
MWSNWRSNCSASTLFPGCAHSEGVTGETRLANWLEEYFDKFNIQTNLLPVGR